MVRRRTIAAFGALALIAWAGWRMWPSAGNQLPSKESAAPTRARALLHAAHDEHEPRPGTLRGLVRAPDGTAVTGTVVVTRFSSALEQPRPLSIQNTDETGRFEISLVPGRYVAGAMKDGFSPAHSDSIDIAEGATIDVVLALGADGCVLHGQVMDEGGGGVPGARLTALTTDRAEGSTAPRVLAATVDQSGAFRLPLACGSYSLRVEASGYLTLQQALVLAGEVERDFRLAPAARLFGRVLTRGERHPVPDATVWLIGLGCN